MCVCDTQQKGVCPVSQRKSVWPGRQMMLETKCSMKKATDIQSYFLVKKKKKMVSLFFLNHTHFSENYVTSC